MSTESHLDTTSQSTSSLQEALRQPKYASEDRTCATSKHKTRKENKDNMSKDVSDVLAELFYYVIIIMMKLRIFTHNLGTNVWVQFAFHCTQTCQKEQTSEGGTLLAPFQYAATKFLACRSHVRILLGRHGCCFKSPNPSRSVHNGCKRSYHDIFMVIVGGEQLFGRILDNL
eukprot:5128359-Amphidinium_carterae.5